MDNKFATAKIECSFENGQVDTFGGNVYFAGEGTLYGAWTQVSFSYNQTAYTTLGFDHRPGYFLDI